MALMVIVMSIAAPSLSRSMRQRNIDAEATRLLAMSEYARAEAISQGVPMTVWIDPAGENFGVAPKAGFTGVESREREYAVNADVHFEMTNVSEKNGVIEAMEFAPDGSPTTTSIEQVRIIDRFNGIVTVAKTSDGWSYEIVKETK